METPLRITFRDIEPSPAVEARVRAKVGKLQTYFDRITGCQVVIEAGHRHQRKGKLYTVRIELQTPRETLRVDSAGRPDQAHEDVYVAVRDAFAAMARQLQDHARRYRGDVKTHAAPA
jgi:ribosomal subunit interface protein